MHMKKLLLVCLAAVALMGCSRTSSETVVTTHEYTYNNSLALKEGRTDSLYVSFKVDFPTDLTNKEALPLIQRSIMEQIFGEGFQDMSLEDAIPAYTEMLYAEYQQNNLPVLAEMGDERNTEEDAFLREDHEITAELVSCFSDRMSYTIEHYAYMGGAHGSDVRTFSIYDMHTGAQLTEQDFFAPGYEPQVAAMLVDNLIAQHDEFSSENDLREAGFYVEEIRPNDNFYLSEEGLVYYFNAYDIAPYALGAVEIVLPYEQVKPLLNEAFRQ